MGVGGGGGGGGGGVAILYEVFLEIPHDVAREKNLDVFIFTLLTNICYKIIQNNCLNKI